VVQLVAQAGLANSPCWSRDGSKLTYERDRNIYIWSMKGKDTKSVSSGIWPTWSPIDDSITFYEAGAYHSFDTKNGSSKRLFSDKKSYSPLWWSPDGRFMAYVSGERFSESTLASEYPDEVRLRVRRTEDGREDWAVRFSRIGPWQDFQWVKIAGGADVK
jgi:Tol biopolymer transport system component